MLLLFCHCAPRVEWHCLKLKWQTNHKISITNMNPRCSQGNMMTQTHTASVATAVCFLNHLSSVLFFSVVKILFHSLNVCVSKYTTAWCTYVSDAVEQVCSVYSQSDSIHSHWQVDRPYLCVYQKNNINSNSRNETNLFFIRLSLSVFPLSSHIQ